MLRSDQGADQSLLTFKMAGDKRQVLPAITSLALNNLLPIEIDLRAALKKDTRHRWRPQTCGANCRATPVTPIKRASQRNAGGTS